MLFLIIYILFIVYLMSVFMKKSQFQPQINELIDKLNPQFPEMEFFKEWCAAADVKTNVIGKDSEHYLKAFTTKAGLISGKNELDIIQLFNTFSDQTWASFSWPEIIQSAQKDDMLWFLMNDIEQSGKHMIDFPSYDQQELINIYKQYKEEFTEFEKFSKWKISTTKSPLLQKYVHSIKTLQRKIQLLEEKLWLFNKMTQTLIKKKQTTQIQDYIHRWKEYVETVIDVDEKNILKLFSVLQSKVKKYDFEYSFGRFWTDHVFTDGKKTQLIDFDNVWYQINGSELVGMIWSNLLYSVENYDSYEEWKALFEKRYDTLLDTNKKYKGLADLLLFQKIIGTIFMDYGNLSFSSDNIKKIEDKGMSAVDNREKWIQWNYRLLWEMFHL